MAVLACHFVVIVIVVTNCHLLLVISHNCGCCHHQLILPCHLPSISLSSLIVIIVLVTLFFTCCLLFVTIALIVIVSGHCCHLWSSLLPSLLSLSLSLYSSLCHQLTVDCHSIVVSLSFVFI